MVKIYICVYDNTVIDYYKLNNNNIITNIGSKNINLDLKIASNKALSKIISINQQIFDCTDKEFDIEFKMLECTDIGNIAMGKFKKHKEILKYISENYNPKSNYVEFIGTSTKLSEKKKYVVNGKEVFYEYLNSIKLKN